MLTNLFYYVSVRYFRLATERSFSKFTHDENEGVLKRQAINRVYGKMQGLNAKEAAELRISWERLAVCKKI